MVISDCQSGSPAVCALPSLSPSWIAVMGRQKFQCLLLSQDVMYASATAM